MSGTGGTGAEAKRRRRGWSPLLPPVCGEGRHDRRRWSAHHIGRVGAVCGSWCGCAATPQCRSAAGLAQLDAFVRRNERPWQRSPRGRADRDPPARGALVWGIPSRCHVPPADYMPSTDHCLVSRGWGGSTKLPMCGAVPRGCLRSARSELWLSDRSGHTAHSASEYPGHERQPCSGQGSGCPHFACRSPFGLVTTTTGQRGTPTLMPRPQRRCAP